MRSGAKASSLSGARFLGTNRLPLRQWLVLFGTGLAVILIEIRNHRHMWIDHQSGQTIWTDHELILELFIFGLVLPILGGVILGYMARTAIERDKITREVALRRRLAGQMQEAQSWQDLAELVVTTPGRVATTDRAWLLAQRSGEEEFDQIAHWERLGQGLLPSFQPVSPTICDRCEHVTELNGSRIFACQQVEPGSDAFPSTRYCLWLSSESPGKTALLFDVPLDTPLDPGQLKVFDDLGGDMFLAIDNANLHYVEQRQGEVAKNERLRIARDLHDTLGQNVTVLRLKLEQISMAMEASGRADFQHEFVEMLLLADETYEQVRDTLEELRTTEHRDLEQDIRLYADQVSKRSGFSVHIQSSGTVGNLTHRQSRQLMYIIREALNNIEKHAGAQDVDIFLRWCEGELILTVDDDGQGFRPEEIGTGDHYGLTIMQERAQAINGILAIDSYPGKGTEITISLLLSERATAAPRIK